MRTWVIISILMVSSLSCLSQVIEKHNLKFKGRIENLEMWAPSISERPRIDQTSEDTSGKGISYWVVQKEKDRVTIQYKLYSPVAFWDTVLTDNAIPAVADSLLTKLKMDNHFSYLDDGILLQHGKNIGYVKGKVRDKEGDKYYQMIFFTTMENALFECEFRCPWRIRKKWAKHVDALANSVRLIKG